MPALKGCMDEIQWDNLSPDVLQQVQTILYQHSYSRLETADKLRPRMRRWRDDISFSELSGSG